MPWVPGLALDGDFGWSVALATLNSPWWMVDGSKQQCDKPNIVTNPKITMNCWYPNGRCGIGLPTLLKSIPKCAKLAFRDEIGPVFYACSVYAYSSEEICVPMKHGNVKKLIFPQENMVSPTKWWRILDEIPKIHQNSYGDCLPLPIPSGNLTVRHWTWHI